MGAAWQNLQNDQYAQRRLRSAWASAQFDQSSLSAWRNIGPLTTYWAHSEDSDPTGRTCHFVGFVVRLLKFEICKVM